MSQQNAQKSPQNAQNNEKQQEQDQQINEFEVALEYLKTNPNKRTHTENFHIFKVMMQIKFFKDLSQNYGKETVEICCSCLRYQETQPGQILFRQGEIGDAFYIIMKGSVGVNINTYVKFEDSVQKSNDNNQEQSDQSKNQHQSQMKVNSTVNVPQSMKHVQTAQNIQLNKNSQQQKNVSNKPNPTNFVKKKSIENGRAFQKQNSISQPEIASTNVVDKDIFEQKVLLQPVLLEVKILKTGDSFGELALLKGSKGAMRAATIISKELTHYAYLVREDYQNILKDKEKDKLNQNVAFLSKVYLFEGLEEVEIRQIFLYCTSKVVQKDHFIYKQDESPDYFYIIKSGDFQVLSIQQIKDKKDVSFFEDVQMPSSFRNFHGRAQKETAISILSSGQYFGHLEILKKSPRKYTVKCLSSEGELYKISSNDFLRKIYYHQKSFLKKRLAEDRQIHSELYEKYDEKLKETNEQNSHLLLQNSYDKQYYDKIINYTKKNSVKLPTVIQSPLTPRKSPMNPLIRMRQDSLNKQGSTTIYDQMISPKSQMNSPHSQINTPKSQLNSPKSYINTPRSQTPQKMMTLTLSQNLPSNIFNKNQQDQSLQKINDLFSSTTKGSNSFSLKNQQNDNNTQQTNQQYSFTPRVGKVSEMNQTSFQVDNQINKQSLIENHRKRENIRQNSLRSIRQVKNEDNQTLTFSNQLNQLANSFNRNHSTRNLSLNLKEKLQENNTEKENDQNTRERSLTQRFAQQKLSPDFFSSVFTTPVHKNSYEIISQQIQKSHQLNFLNLQNPEIKKHSKSTFIHQKQNSEGQQILTERSEITQKQKSIQNVMNTQSDDPQTLFLQENSFIQSLNNNDSFRENSPFNNTQKFRTASSEPIDILKYNCINDSFTQDLINKYQTNITKRRCDSLHGKNKQIMEQKYFENHQKLMVEMQNLQEQERLKKQQKQESAIKVMNKMDGYRSLKKKYEGIKQVFEAKSEKGIFSKETKNQILNRFFTFLLNQDQRKEQNKKVERYQFTDFRNFEKIIEQKAAQLKIQHQQQKAQQTLFDLEKKFQIHQ